MNNILIVSRKIVIFPSMKGLEPIIIDLLYILIKAIKIIRPPIKKYIRSVSSSNE